MQHLWRLRGFFCNIAVVVLTSRLLRAFDTLAKALHPADGSAGDSLEATMQLMSGDQSGPVVELDGSLLSEIHIPFKVPPTLIPLKTQWVSFE